jgi:hypothetical protein
LVGATLSYHLVWGGLGFRPPSLWSYLSVQGSSPRWTEHIKGGFYPCQRVLPCGHGNHGDYACSGGRIPMPGIKGLETGTSEFPIRCAWVSVVTSYYVRSSLAWLPRNPAVMVPAPYCVDPEMENDVLDEIYSLHGANLS